jgi:hypothetical protein
MLFRIGRAPIITPSERLFTMGEGKSRHQNEKTIHFDFVNIICQYATFAEMQWNRISRTASHPDRWTHIGPSSAGSIYSIAVHSILSDIEGGDIAWFSREQKGALQLGESVDNKIKRKSQSRILYGNDIESCLIHIYLSHIMQGCQKFASTPAVLVATRANPHSRHSVA